ncbi:hypothetical protein FGE12_28655 [Aggregicoccus sp. 17bor-14]|uniref:hypothetical protein n=1 Tax=Myxococcaceae TaxID=31 RepID=UPI00129C9DA3|nr:MULTISPECIES: hypothetical protein [Myxococcaceae]MBF5046419.1 hypothetical protein [Simulacricoccus sp. 17bor-14]MRI92138.1 hypothetical protein [Aggregicoccus sp. 17bor-14]
MSALAHAAEEFFAREPELSLAALGSRESRGALDLLPCGRGVEFLAAEEHGAWAQQYLTLNQHAFGPLGLPRWVLSDLYLLPSVVGLVRAPSRLLREDVQQKLALPPESLAIAAAYVAVPALTPGLFAGVSLLSFLPGAKASAWVKTLTLKMLGAQRLRGVTQWDSSAVRVHTRLGPMRLVGRAPGSHEYAERTFVYETDLRTEDTWARCMRRELQLPHTRRVRTDDASTLAALLDRAQGGEPLYLVPPGLDDGHVLVHEGAL